MSDLLDALPGLVWVDAEAGGTTGVSAGCRDYTGSSAEELAGAGWTEQVHPDDRAPMVVARGGRAAVEVRIRRRDGAWRRHSVRWTTYGERWIGTATEVETERELATLLERTEERRLHQALAVDFDVWDWDLTRGVPESWYERVLEADRDRIRRGIAETIAARRAQWVDEFRTLRRDGTVAFVLARGTIMHDAHGTPMRLVGGCSDITAQRRAEAGQAQSARGLAAATEMLAAPVGLPGILQLFAEIARDLVGGATGLAWLASDGAPPRAQAAGLRVPIIAPGGAVLGEVAVDGTPPERLAHASALLGPLARVAASAIEKTRLVTDLEALVAERIEADRRKDEFLAMLAHELRNPLAPVLTAVELLTTHPPVEVADHYIGIMQRQINRLTRLVDDLLDVSRITRGKIELRAERVDVRLLVTRALESTAPAVKARDHVLTVDLPSEELWVDGDPTRLEQVLSNLIVNAAKYTDPRGSLHVAVRREDERVRIAVRDSGIGIAPDMLDRIFDLFGQVDQSLARTDGGLGIGLTLVKRLVGMHRGTVSAHSAGLGQGSELVVLLPLAIAAPEA